MNLFQKINEVQKIVKTVLKDAEISMGQGKGYLAVSHDTVSSELHMPLANAGIVAFPNMDECKIEVHEKIKVWNGQETKQEFYMATIKASVTFINSDDPEDRMTSYATAYAFDSSDKATGKAYSMAIKTIYLKTFMLESLDKEEERVVEPDAGYSQKTPSVAKGLTGSYAAPQAPQEPKKIVQNAALKASPAQVTGLNVIIDKKNISPEFILEMLKKYGVSKIAELNRVQYQEMRRAIEDMQSSELPDWVKNGQ